MPTFPLATLAAQVTAQGITAPSYSDILNSLIASFQAIYGSDAYLAPDGQDYQLLAIFATAQNDSNQTLIAIYNGRSPANAQGVDLSSQVKINGLARLAASNSTATVTLTGAPGTQILSGVVRDINNNLWDIPDTIIPNSGSISVTATSQVIGDIAAAANTLTTIDTPVLGWQSVTNPAGAVTGAPVETDAALRRRQAISTTLPSQTPLSAIASAIANLPGVQRSIVYENNTNAPDANGIPAHSIAAVVQGGDITQTAQTIESKKSPGTGTFGTTTITVNDPGGLPVAISFYQLTTQDIFVSLTIHPLTGYNAGVNAQITQAIKDFINGLPIGDSVLYNWLFAPATLNGNLTFKIIALTVGIAANPVGVVDVAIAFNVAAICSSLVNIVLTVA